MQVDTFVKLATEPNELSPVFVRSQQVIPAIFLPLTPHVTLQGKKTASCCLNLYLRGVAN